jgi:hypothetical protein
MEIVDWPRRACQDWADALNSAHERRTEAAAIKKSECYSPDGCNQCCPEKALGGAYVCTAMACVDAKPKKETEAEEIWIGDHYNSREIWQKPKKK